MATRADLPKNPDMDRHREEMREIVFAYLRDHTTREEKKAIIKEALDEWLDKKAEKLGWLSFRMIVYAGFAGYVYIWFTTNGWRKP